MYVCNLGYGYQWAEQMLNAFKEEAWVKEKYPNLQVSFSQMPWSRIPRTG